MNGRKRILFFISSLGGGGAERAVITYCRYIDRERFEPFLVLLNDTGTLKSEFPPEITIDELRKRSRWNVIALLFRLRKVIVERMPDIIVSNLTYCNILVLLTKRLFALRVPVIVIDHVHVSSALQHIRYAFIRRMLIQFLYRHAEKVINVSREGVRDMVERFHIDEHRAQCIYNPVDIERIQKQAQEANIVPDNISSAIPLILSVGRLTEQKDFPTLLRAFAVVLRERDAFLVMLGEGEERASLVQRSKNLGIDNRVFFAGFQKNPYPFFRRADCFVLSSRYEGFGIVLVEAMVCGCPVVSTDCLAGPNEIIEERKSGLLVPVGESESLAKKILSVISDRGLSDKLKTGGMQRAGAFHHFRIVEEYERLFESILSRGHP